MITSKSPQKAWIGLMSGTSLDGVDGVLTRFSASPGNRTIPETLVTASRPIPAPLREALRALAAGKYNSIPPGSLGAAQSTDPLENCALAANVLTDLYLDVVRDLCAAAPETEVCAAGAHGQTIRHRPESGFTIQILNGARLAALSGIPCICDFRSADVALGGQGAPLVPLFHQEVLAEPGEQRLILNLGGIANISILSAEGTRGFDTGPASTLLDAWCMQNRGEAYDRDGAWAASGRPDDRLLELMLAEPYFSLPPPKSTGRELFSLDWLAEKLNVRLQEAPGLARAGGLRPEDIQATLSRLTARSIADAVRSILAVQANQPQPVRLAQALFACGGGVRNTRLMKDIQTSLNERPDGAPVRVTTTNELGIDPQSMEASAFAWLAWKRWEGEALDYRAVTGARRPETPGAVYLP